MRLCRLVGRVRTAGTAHARRRVVIGAAWAHVASVRSAVVTEVLLTESCKALLLGNRVDVCADDERHDVEEGDPELIREELLGESQADGGGDPRNTHHLPKANLDGGTNLVVGTSTGNESHGDQVDAVLNGSNLGLRLATRCKSFSAHSDDASWCSSQAGHIITALFAANHRKLDDKPIHATPEQTKGVVCLLTIRLLTRICRILARRLVRPLKAF